MTDEEIEDILQFYGDYLLWCECTVADVREDVLLLVEALKEAREQQETK